MSPTSMSIFHSRSFAHCPIPESAIHRELLLCLCYIIYSFMQCLDFHLQICGLWHWVHHITTRNASAQITKSLDWMEWSTVVRRFEAGAIDVMWSKTSKSPWMKSEKRHVIIPDDVCETGLSFCLFTDRTQWNDQRLKVCTFAVWEYLYTTNVHIRWQ